MARQASVVLCARALAASLALGGAAPCARADVIVSGLAPGGFAAQAGLALGDRLTSHGPLSTPLDSPFDFERLVTLQAPRGPVRLNGWRDRHARVFTLALGEWGLTVEANLPADVRQRDAQARQLAAQALPVRAEEQWLAAARELAAQGRAHDAAWLLARAAEAEEPSTERATRLFAAARAVLPRGDLWSLSLLFELEGQWLERRSLLPAAVAAQQRALALRQRLSAAGLMVARSHERLALVETQRARPDLAHDHWRRCAAIRGRLAPRSLEHVRALNGLAGLAFQRGDLRQALRGFRRARELAETLDPTGFDVAKALVNIAMAARRMGELAEADESCQRALRLLEKHGAGTSVEARALNTLALTARDRGDGARARDLFERALVLAERLSPNGADTAGILNNLGNLERERGDAEAARSYHERALRLRERLEPESLDVAASLVNLGSLARRVGRLDEAESLLRRSLALKERLAPESLTCAPPLEELAEVARVRGQDESALELHTRALALRTRHTPRSATTAEQWALTAGTLERLGRDSEAIEHYRQALASIDEGAALAGGGDFGRAGLSARFSDVQRRAVDLLVRAGRSEEAFAVSERGRARALLLALFERDLAFSDVPRELERERRRLAAQYDRVQAELADLSPRTQAALIEPRARRLRELQAQRAWVELRIRKAAPRLGAVRRPRSLDLAGARAVLDRGSVLLSFSVGESRTLLFVVQPTGAQPGFAVHVLPFGAQALADRVHALRGFIERGRTDPGSEAAFVTQSARLYADLLGPARAALDGAKRLLVVPDGPLHGLPFAALVRGGAKARYLVEDLPLHTVLSATLYGELRRQRGAGAATLTLAAFGAPAYPAEADPATGGGQVPLRARALQPLPASADEVRAIAALFPGAARVHLGPQASEARARALPRATRYVHFAVHALLDWRSPLDSALAFTPPSALQPGVDNGVLQAWEVFESVRLDAELVTLSACETALGREMGGEGLVGLVRAFHYAGARAVLASLWAVSDRSTAELMQAFYARLRAGTPKDEALRQAQLQVRRTRPHPFHWAAFQVSGDVR